MNVLQLHNRYRSPGGEDVVVEREADVLRRAGHRVTQVVADNPEGDLAAARTLLVAPWNRSSRVDLESVIDEDRPDVAHVHNTWFALSPSVVAALVARRIPVVMTLHNYRLLCLNGLLLREGAPCRLCVGNSPLDGVRFRCYRDSYVSSAVAALTLGLGRLKGIWNDIDLFLANSEFVRDTYLSAGFDSDKLSVKYNFTSDPGERTMPVEESDTVLFVGRISPEKGIGFLTTLWSEGESSLRLRVIGDGPLRDNLEKRHPEVEFTGKLSSEEVAAEMLQARALVFPSLAFEACPLVLLEAFASGLPVMASDRGAMADIAAPLGPRWLRAAADRGDWGRGMRLLEDGGEVRAAGSRAREAYEASFTPEIALDRMEEAYARATS